MTAIEKEETAKQLKDLQQYGINLTEWEEHFIETIQDQLSSHGNVSERQREILKTIWEKKV